MESKLPIFKVTGKVLVKETNEGIADLIVHIFDFDVLQKKNLKEPEDTIDTGYFPYDSLGSVITNAKGEFEHEYSQDDFNITENNDKRPELYIVITTAENADEKAAKKIEDRAVYISSPIRWKAGKTESFIIKISENKLKQFDAITISAEKLIHKKNSIIEKNQKLIAHAQEQQKIIDQKVNMAFEAFTLSKIPATVRESNYYLRSTDNLTTQMNSLIDAKLLKMESTSTEKTMRLRFTQSQLEEHGLWRDGAPIAGTIEKAKIKDIINNNSLEKQSVHTCNAMFTEADLEMVQETPSNETIPSAIEEITSININHQIGTQLKDSTGPETALQYNNVIDENYKNKNICDSINQFALCGGPADVTAFHDFQTVQIAFEHVWTELFDKNLISQSREFYSEILRISDWYSPETSRYIRESSRWETIPTVNELQDMIESLSPELAENHLIKEIINKIQTRLSERYNFTIFAPNSYNYGIVYTFRQQWEPQNYQVGKLISSLPLAPKEVRKYSMKRIITKSKNEKFLTDSEFKGKLDTSSTSRAENEIIKRAQNNSNFSLNAGASGSIGPISMHADTTMGSTAEKFSQDTKKNFREAVLNAVEEYRKQNKSEIEFGYKDEYTTESSGEIANPNDEITVTYLFYELQRQYDISEFLHKITPVILVANEVPMPHEIDIDWLLANAWILKRILLDDSFLMALNNLKESPVGDSMAIENLKLAKIKQEEIVQTLLHELELKNGIIQNLKNRLEGITYADQATDIGKQVFDTINSVLNPFGGMGSTPDPNINIVKDFTKESLEQADKERREVASSLQREQSTLQQMIDKYNKELREFYDKQTAITQLKIHIKENILYYMQRIWDYESTDQRFFRLFDKEIEWFDEEDTELVADIVPSITPGFGGYYDFFYAHKPRMRRVHSSERKKLVEIADLDNMLGYKGNYMIFPVKEISYLHAYMLREFIDNSTNGIKDADEFANYKTQDLIEYLKCVKLNQPSKFEAEKNIVIALINERLTSTRKEKERIVIPTNSTYIEALPGKHPVMEDFKLAHRSLDVKKVQAEVRHAELENLRLAARLLEGEREDPEIEKVVINKNV